MATKTGTIILRDLLSNQTLGSIPVAELGEDRLAEAIGRDLDTMNALMRDQLGEFCEFTTDRIRRIGSSDAGEMIPANEFTRGPTQKVLPAGSNVGFPLRGYQYNVGWTQLALDNATGADVARQTVAGELAFARKVRADLQRAIYTPTNQTFTDYLMNPQVDLPVRRFLNADSEPIPPGPNSEVFDSSTHTHYLATNGWTAAALTNVISTIEEHDAAAEIRVAISRTDETTVRGLTGFILYIDPALQLGTGQVATQRLEMNNPGNRAIGRFGNAEVWVKPWAIASYATAWNRRPGADKPLACRTRRGGAPALRPVATNRLFPLLVDFMLTEFGFGAWGRSNGAVAYMGGVSYTAPTITG